jgi:CRISPR-associated protein (TIGR03986 family)
MSEPITGKLEWKPIPGKPGLYPFVSYFNSKKGKEVTRQVENQSVLVNKLKDQCKIPTEVQIEFEEGALKKIRLPGHDAPSDRNRFHNPYNFVPAPPRTSATDELGDREPFGHDRFAPDCFSGRLKVSLTTQTPLLAIDASRVRVLTETAHKIFSIRLGQDNLPHLPVTGIKGMLRSAFEIVTNSRMGVLEKHNERLAYRMDTKAGARMVPARIERTPNGQDLNIVLYRGTSSRRDDGSLQGPMYAAWLPKYGRQARHWGGLDTHQKEVWIRIEPRKSRKDFDYWSVIEMADGAQPKPVSPGQRWEKGFVCITNHNIDNKHDERVFFDASECVEPRTFPLDDKLKAQWKRLIENYQEIHRDEERPPAQQRAVFSRHVKGSKEEAVLSEGTLCYAFFNEEGALSGLYPVIISRSLFPSAPIEFLHPTLQPAKNVGELSPADRVFGWVNQNSDGAGAYRGQVRIGAVTCRSSRSEAIESFSGDGEALAILGAPKPQQGRFYLGASPNGDAQAPHQSNARAGYENPDKKGLRGRKVYPHHRNFSETQAKRADGTRDSQNRSVTGWVKPGCRFEFDLHFCNLSQVELGALLYLLTLPAGRFLRFGGGKPLGFGSVRLELDRERTEIRDFDQLSASYLSFQDSDAASGQEAAKFVASFKTSLERSYGPAPKFLRAFERATAGFEDELPIHYPRKKQIPNGESFDWFVENSRIAKGQVAKGYVLPNLTDDQGLPYFD